MEPTKRGHYKGRKIVVSHPYTADQTFDSISIAAKFLDMPRQSIERYLSGEYKKCRRGFTFKYADDEQPIKGAGEMDNLLRVVENGIPYLPNIVVQRIHPDAVTPTYTSEGDSGMDVYAIEDLLLHPAEIAKCPLGILIEIPRHPWHDYGYRWELQARPRSGVSYKSALRLPNSPATIDNFYRGEITIIVENVAQREYELDVDKTDVGEFDRVVETVKIETMTSVYARRIDGKEDNEKKYAERGSIQIRKGDRIAQLIFVQVIRPLEIVEGVVSTDTDRGAKGFGSSGFNGS